MSPTFLETCGIAATHTAGSHQLSEGLLSGISLEQTTRSRCETDAAALFAKAFRELVLGAVRNECQHHLGIGERRSCPHAFDYGTATSGGQEQGTVDRFGHGALAAFITALQNRQTIGKPQREAAVQPVVRKLKVLQAHGQCSTAQRLLSSCSAI